MMSRLLAFEEALTRFRCFRATYRSGSGFEGSGRTFSERRETMANLRKYLVVSLLSLMLAVPAGAVNGGDAGKRETWSRWTEELGAAFGTLGIWWSSLKCGVTIDPNGSCNSLPPPPPPETMKSDCGVIIDPNGLCHG